MVDKYLNNKEGLLEGILERERKLLVAAILTVRARGVNVLLCRKRAGSEDGSRSVPYSCFLQGRTVEKR